MMASQGFCPGPSQFLVSLLGQRLNTKVEDLQTGQAEENIVRCPQYSC